MLKAVVSYVACFTFCAFIAIQARASDPILDLTDKLTKHFGREVTCWADGRGDPQGCLKGLQNIEWLTENPEHDRQMRSFLAYLDSKSRELDADPKQAIIYVTINFYIPNSRSFGGRSGFIFYVNGRALPQVFLEYASAMQTEPYRSCTPELCNYRNGLNVWPPKE